MVSRSRQLKFLPLVNKLCFKIFTLTCIMSLKHCNRNLNRSSRSYRRTSVDFDIQKITGGQTLNKVHGCQFVFFWLREVMLQRSMLWNVYSLFSQ